MNAFPDHAEGASQDDSKESGSGNEQLQLDCFRELLVTVPDDTRTVAWLRDQLAEQLNTSAKDLTLFVGDHDVSDEGNKAKQEEEDTKTLDYYLLDGEPWFLQTPIEVHVKCKYGEEVIVGVHVH